MFSFEYWPTFQANISSSSSGSKNRLSKAFSSTYHQFKRGILLGFSIDHKYRSNVFSETSADFQRTTLRYIPRGSAFHNHRFENLKSKTVVCCLMKTGLTLYERKVLSVQYLTIVNVPAWELWIKSLLFYIGNGGWLLSLSTLLLYFLNSLLATRITLDSIS
jgi:hypothetical protein